MLPWYVASNGSNFPEMEPQSRSVPVAPEGFRFAEVDFGRPGTNYVEVGIVSLSEALWMKTKVVRTFLTRFNRSYSMLCS